MTKAEQTRLMNLRHKMLQHAELTGNVAMTCRHFGISRQKFYKWRRRFESHGAAVCATSLERPSAPPTQRRPRW